MLHLNVMPKNPERYNCQMYYYSNSHSMLYIQVQHEKDVRYIGFQDTLYFSGFKSWQGSRIERLSDTECGKLLETAGYSYDTGSITISHLIKDIGYSLFRVENSTPPILILARSVDTYTQEDMNKILRLLP